MQQIKNSYKSIYMIKKNNLKYFPFKSYFSEYYI